MSDALFGADAMPAEAPQQEERRTKLYGYDAVAAQMLEPYGESPLGSDEPGTTVERHGEGEPQDGLPQPLGGAAGKPIRGMSVPESA